MKKSFFFLVVVGSLFVGCGSSSGNLQVKKADMETLNSGIQKNITKKEEVKKILGDYTIAEVNKDGLEVWTFVYAESTTEAKNYIPLVGLFSGGASIKQKYIIVTFNEDNTVKDYQVKNLDKQVKTGILN